MKLSEHFSLSEFERSATATKLGIDNSVPSQYIPALQQLCKEILEPLREFAGQPIIISSGYRCPQLNIKVGGVYSSQHTLGEACDIRIPRQPYRQAMVPLDDGQPPLRQAHLRAFPWHLLDPRLLQAQPHPQPTTGHPQSSEEVISCPHLKPSRLKREGFFYRHRHRHR